MPQIEAPPQAELETMLGSAFPAFQQVQNTIEGRYEMDILWSTGGKAAPYEKKYRRGGKTLCALYPKPGMFGFMMVLGKMEQARFEAEADSFSPAVQQLYEDTKVYHDGRWLMLWMEDGALLPDVEKLLPIKRRPNRKA